MSTSFPLVVKWGKETINVSFMPEAGVRGLKTELEEKTGVPSDRMKLMAKSKGLWKGVLKDDLDLLTIDWASALSKSAGNGGLQVLLMGSASELSAPKQRPVFIEDLPPAELAKVKEPSGLINLGTKNGMKQSRRELLPLVLIYMTSVRREYLLSQQCHSVLKSCSGSSPRSAGLSRKPERHWSWCLYGEFAHNLSKPRSTV
jgi:hypothetical protein